MRIRETKQFTVIKTTEFLEKSGLKSLKCTIEIREKMFSHKLNKYYYQKEIWFDAIIRGTEEELQEIRNRLLETTKKINENKALPKEERKNMNPKAVVKINAFEFDYVTYFFPTTKTFRTSIIIDKWDFTNRKLHKEYESSIFTKEQVEEQLRKQENKLKIKFEKELRKQHNDIVNSTSRKVLF